jgi:hypothetical protein
VFYHSKKAKIGCEHAKFKAMFLVERVFGEFLKKILKNKIIFNKSINYLQIKYILLDKF